MRTVFLRVFCLALASCAAPLRAQVTSPSQHLGRPLAADFTLADWEEVAGYHERLAAESPRVSCEQVGTTTEGRRFLLTVVSSERNLARLDEIRAAARLLADPRGASAEARREALERGVPILMVSNAMHSNETAAPQFGMELAYRLATSDEEPWRSARERLVVLILPCTNPDGLDHTVQWYRANVGTPHEAAGMTRLYQLYAGHDNNRDWFMLSLEETRIVTELLYKVWHPTVYWDVHQQGSGAERMFVPPFRDPLNPNLDPAVIASINALGTRAVLDMTRQGYTGVATGVSFDMWWNGGNRNVPVRHNIIGLLTEAASVQIASPIFLKPEDLRSPLRGAYGPSNQFPAPWPGGWWRLRDIVDYELAFAGSLVGSLAAEPATWLAGALSAADRAIERGQSGAPRAWILPSDNRDVGATRRLVDTLLRGGVELHVSPQPIDAEGRRWPAGSIVIRRDQPYGDHVKDLFEVQRYPEGEPPYDVAGWTLPMLLGVQRVEVIRALDVPLAPAGTLEVALEAFRGGPRAGSPGLLDAGDSDTWPEVFGALARGEQVTWLPEGTFARGERSGGRVLRGLPRVGLYSPWSGSMDEGWMRWVLERFQLPYVTVRNEMLRAGRLSDLLDVLIVPDVSAGQLNRGRAAGSAPPEFTGGLDPEGAVAVEEFVRGGGRLLVSEGSAGWAVDLFGLPLVDVARGKEAGDFSCPGSVLRTLPRAHWMAAGLPDSLPVFFSRGSAWRPMSKDERNKLAAPAYEGDPEVLLSWAPTRLLLSGWIKSPETISGQGAWVRARHGSGTVHLFAFSPQFRAWTQGSFSLLFRAALLDRP